VILIQRGKIKIDVDEEKKKYFLLSERKKSKKINISIDFYDLHSVEEKNI